MVDRDPRTPKQLAELAYAELRVLASREMGRERRDHTLQPTALVHEAYLRLVGDDVSFDNRAHFFAAAATSIRRVLVEHARKHARAKRGGGHQRVALAHEDLPAPVRDDRMIALDEALRELEAFDPKKAQLVELRFFAGMTIPEAAETMSISESTVVRDWRLARAWMISVLGDDE